MRSRLGTSLITPFTHSVGMRRAIRDVAWLTLILTGSASVASAQATSQLSADVYLSVGRAEQGPSKVDIGPAWATVGSGLMLPGHRLFALIVEGHQSLGESTRPVAGTGGRRGMTSMTVASVSASLGLFDRDVQPFVGVGLSALHEKGVTTSPETTSAAERTYSYNDVGLATVLGLRLIVSKRLAVRVEYRAYAGKVQQFNLGIGYRWQ